MKKRLWLLPLGIAVAAVILFFYGRQGAWKQGGQPEIQEDYVLISVDGVEYARVPLSQPQTVTVTQETGEVNVIDITNDGAVMASSSCKNQLCVHMGAVTTSNWELRPNQQFIVCLPNRVTVELVVNE